MTGPLMRISVALRAMIAAFLFLAAVPATAQNANTPLHVRATLSAETATPAPARDFTVAFLMTPDSGWHGYWVNGGDAGLGMELDWKLPKGVRAGNLRYPVPQPLMIGGLMNYVYERPYALLSDLTIDASVPAGTRLPISVNARWLACTDRICVPQSDTLALEVVAGDGKISAADAGRFGDFRAALPVPLDRQGRYEINGNFIEIAVPFSASAALDSPYFYSGTTDVIGYSVQQSARRVGDWIVIKAGYRPGTETGFAGTIGGVMRYGEASDGRPLGLSINAVAGKVPAGGQSVAALNNEGRAHPAVSPENLLVTLALAILGGFLLNAMPCVFPILGLKALALAKMGGDEREARRDALAYTGGVMISVVALGAVMLILRAGGQQIGWAFQLQEPRIVLLLMLLMAAVTLNLWGAFELATIDVGNKIARKAGLAGSFWTGVLAAVVATPCTGPFMAAALGAALVLPTGAAIAVFAGLGLGLALPYLLIGFVPAVRRMLPKPGAWLIRFRKAMAIPMALTALALLWLLWRLSGSFGLILGGSAAATIAILLLFIGNAQRRSGMTPPVMAVSVLALAALAFAALPREPAAIRSSGTKPVLTSEPYTGAALAKYRRAGFPVFVYFTADWCVTCKINEASAIQRKDVAKAFSASGVKTLVGDFTRRDPELALVLAQHGRSGVPLYLFYAPGAGAEILPQILSKSDLTERARRTRRQ
jgi:thiol:disulfide interchange protein/DsbC/DsbD-like thiol-disulfide interchange protein